MKVCIIGSGNWGSAISRIVGANAAKFDEFDNTVNMWVFEEMIDGKKLTEIINTTHENVKYLPGYKLPENVVAVPDVVEAAKDADLLIWVLPHQFVPGVCGKLKNNIKKTAFGISLIKGVHIKDKGLELISQMISEELDGMRVYALMGANIAKEVAAGNYCETTIGCSDKDRGGLLKKLFEVDTFRVVVVADEHTVELCGALKNIVAVGAGFVDGLKLGDNTKAAVIRLGLMEMISFAKSFYKDVETSTFLESCGVADLITTCYGGRNRRVAEAFIVTGKVTRAVKISYGDYCQRHKENWGTIFQALIFPGVLQLKLLRKLRSVSLEELEAEMLNGQKLQGPQTALEVNKMLKGEGLEERYPLFTAIYKICYEGEPAAEFIQCLHNHPEHMPQASL